MANEEQRKYWSEIRGPTWLERETDLAQAGWDFTRAVIDRANVQPGERILDIGCGTGATTLQLAELAGDGGGALGLDISTLFVDFANKRAPRNVEFVAADAQTFRFQQDFDLVFSQFGIMFFEDPVVAFANLRSALRPSGRLVFAAWHEPMNQQWQTVPIMAMAPVLGGLEPPAPSDGPPPPGPFSLADEGRTRQVLGDAGFSEINLERFDGIMSFPIDKLDTWADFFGNMGPLGDAYREADHDTRRRAWDAMRESVKPFVKGDELQAPGAAWIVSAKP